MIPTNPFRSLNTQVPQGEREEKIKQQFKEVSDMYEKQFLQEMMKSMRSTVSESGLIKTNQAEKIFREQLDQEYVDKWGKVGGIGLSEVIYNNMIEKFGPRYGLTKSIEKPIGPLELKENDTVQLQRVNAGEKAKENDKIEFLFDQIQKKDKGAIKIQQPWTGYLSKKVQLSADEYFLEMNHENGLKSKFHLKGQVPELKTNELIPAGGYLGYVNPDQNSFRWVIE